MDTNIIAENILARQFNHPVRLSVVAQLRSSMRSHVYRCSALGQPDEAPETVIIKHTARPDRSASASSDVDENVGQILNDWAGLQLVDTVAAKDVMVPLCFGGDPSSGLIVLEDMGEGRSLRDVLEDDDRAHAEAALISYFAALGKLHARTHGHQALFHSLRTSLGPYHPEGTLYRHRYAQTASRFHGMMQQLQITPPPGADQDIATVLATLLDPGPFLVYIHGDPGPRNCLLVGRAPCLIDFESGTYDHALLEGVQARMLFPTSPYVNLTPQHITHRAEHAYRTELAQTGPAAADDTLFDQAFVAACAYWAINFCEWLPFSELLIADQSWGTTTLRQRIVVRADIFAQTAEELGYLEALGTAFQMIGSKIRRMWPDAADSMPLYPAFRSLAPTRGM